MKFKPPYWAWILSAIFIIPTIIIIVWNKYSFYLYSRECAEIKFVEVSDKYTWQKSINEKLPETAAHFRVQLKVSKWIDSKYFPQISRTKMPIMIDNKVVGYRSDVSYTPVSIENVIGIYAGRAAHQCYFEHPERWTAETDHVRNYNTLWRQK